MKEILNWKSAFAAAVLIIVGIGLIVGGAYITISLWKSVFLGVGSSLIASAIVIFMHDFFVERIKVSNLDEWGIEKMYATRAEKNADSDPQLDKAKYKVDGVAFGLSSFRTKYTTKVEQCLKKGVSFRIITMNPNSKFITEREIEEGINIKESINNLIEWANNLNNKKYKGKIIVKGYNSMTLDFYWRVDDSIYVGPYWYGYKSSDTPTLKFSNKNGNSKAFDLYAEYFESLWDNDNLTTILTNPVRTQKKQKLR